jgi:hypothetical protein
MIHITKEEIVRRTANLPADLKTASQSDQTVLELQAIAKNHNLHVDQIGTVADLVELTLSGVVLTREFVAMMTESLPGLKREQIMALAEEINRRVFAPYRVSLHNLETRAQEQGAGESIAVPEHIKAPVPPPAVILTAAPTAAPVTIPAPSISTPIEVAKVTAPVTSISQERDISHENRDSRLKMIPDDAKARISSDPYKESIE